MEFLYEKIIETLTKLNTIEELRGKLFVSGGIVPWIVSETDSGRTHGDIDLICKQEDMALVRQKLKEYNIYASELDSLTYVQSGESQDYGVDTYVGGVPIGFYPYETKDGKIIQRSFSPNLVDGTPDLKVKIFEGLEEQDYLTFSMLSDGTMIGHSTLEIIRATKIRAHREKDYYDISQIDKIGIDNDRWARIVEVVRNMKDTLAERREKKKENRRKSNDWDEI